MSLISREALIEKIASDYSDFISDMTSGFWSTPDEYQEGVRDEYQDIIDIINRMPAESPSDEEEPKKEVCVCYKEGHWYLKECGTCMGTKDREPTMCGGDKDKCDAY